MKQRSFLMRSGLRLSAVLALALLVSACVPSGVANISPNGGKLAIVNNSDLYVYSQDGSGPDFYAFLPDSRFEPALSPDGTAIVFVDRGGRLTYQPLDGSPSRVLLPNSVSDPGPGAISFLPDGHLLFIEVTSTSDRDLRIFDVSNGQTLLHLSGIGEFFIDSQIIKPRTTTSLVSPYSIGRIDASQVTQFNLVLLPSTCQVDTKACYYSYTADTTGFHDNGPLPRIYDTDAQIFLSRRVEDDLTSGVLSPDGKHVILRMRSIVDPQGSQSLYLLDLTTNDPPVILVDNALGRPDYSVAPGGTQIAYEERINGVAFVRLYNLATGERSDLGPGTLDPQWWK